MSNTRRILAQSNKQTPMENYTPYLGISGKANIKRELAVRYNELFNHLGSEEMLIMWERWADEQDIEGMIEHTEDILKENNINI